MADRSSRNKGDLVGRSSDKSSEESSDPNDATAAREWRFNQ